MIGFSMIQKCTAALRMLAYETPGMLGSINCKH
jgi:hypothetical protein